MTIKRAGDIVGKRAVLLAVGIAAAAFNVHATTYYLSPDGNDGNSGTSETAAFKTINKAVSRLHDQTGSRDELIIAPGRYVVTGVLSMAGQYTSDSSAVDVIRGATGNPADVVLDGDGQHNIMNLGRGVLVHGLTFSNGVAKAAATGGGVRVSSSGSSTYPAIVSNCVFTCCSTATTKDDFKAAGAAYVYGAGKLVDCVVENCRADYGVAGVFLNLSYGCPTVQECTIRECVGTNCPGGVSAGGNAGGRALVAGCFISNCVSVASFGGGILAHGAHMLVSNTVISACEAVGGGGAYGENRLDDGFVACRIVGNRAGYGAGLYMVTTMSGCAVVSNVITQASHNGAGFYPNRPDPVFVTNCVFIGNDNSIEQTSADHGHGGAIVLGGAVTNAVVIDCEFRENRACNSAGAFYVNVSTNLYLSPSTVLLRNCRFYGNEAKTGGALTLAERGSCRLESCVFSGNAAGGQGGAIRVFNRPRLSAEGCVFDGNVSMHGGALSLRQDSGSFAFTNCVFVANTATNFGGAVACDADNFPNGNDGPSPYGIYGEFFGCTFTNNVAWGYGGALFLRDGQTGRNSGNPLVLRNSLFAGNRVTTGGRYHCGGAIYLVSKDAPVIDACTIAGNDVVRNDSTQCGGGLYHRWTGSVVNTIVAHNTLNGSLEENKNWFNAIYAVNSCAYPPPSDSRFRAAEGCVTTDPLFANAAAGDYGLTVASPCKDTGAVESWMADAYDLAGAPRVFGAAPDMGCFERTYPLGTLLLFK